MDKERLERFSDGEFEQFTVEELLANGKLEDKKVDETDKSEEPKNNKPPTIIAL